MEALASHTTIVVMGRKENEKRKWLKEEEREDMDHTSPCVSAFVEKTSSGQQNDPRVADN